MSESKPVDTPNLSGILERVMSNPQALNMLSGLLSNVPPTSSENPDKARVEEKAPSAIEVSTPRGYPPPSVSEDKRIRFLKAIRPFITDNRSDTIEKMIRICEALHMLRALSNH